MATDVFDRQKAAAINGIDQSRKGSVDEQILELVTFINSLDDYFTTSSCSGRIILLEDQNDIDEAVRKKGCKWLFTSHSMVTHPQKITEALSKSTGKAVFKFEPLVLHVQCRTIECAQHLLCCAVGSGFRNSGISIGNKGKILVLEPEDNGTEIMNALQYVRPGNNFKANIDIFEMTEVNGKTESPLFTYLKKYCPPVSDTFEDGLFYSPLKDSDVRWNFEQFLIDRKGRVAFRVAPEVDPLKLRQDIIKLIQD